MKGNIMGTEQLKAVAAATPQAARDIKAMPREKQFPAMLESFKTEIARALPRHLNPDRMARIALTEFRKNPKLAQCEPASVFAAIIQASQLGLEPGLMGQAYLIPYGSECQLIPGYQGLVDLVRRSGLVKRIEAHVVYERDKFTYRTGMVTVLEHEPCLDGDRGEMRLAYAVAEFSDGGYHVEVMGRQQIESIRDRGQNYKNAQKYKKSTPWDTDAEEMWRKTVIRRISKYLPKSAELAIAVSLNDAAEEGGQHLAVKDAIEGTWAPIVGDDRPEHATNETTFAHVMDAINRAKSSDDLDAAADLIGEVADETQRAELGAAYKSKRESMEK
jgi:recombination protein RecT